MQARDRREVATLAQRLQVGARPRVLVFGRVQIAGQFLDMTGALREVGQEKPVPDVAEVLAGVAAGDPRLVKSPAHGVHDTGHLLGLGPDPGIVA